jgi:hypothetical protein
VVLIDEQQQPHLIRQAETLEYMETPELVPPHLK